MSDLILTKVCTQCDIEKTIEYFYKDRRRKDGYRTICKQCMLASEASRYRASPEKKRIAAVRRYAENREWNRERKAGYYARNAERLRAAYKANPYRQRAAAIKWRASNREKARAMDARYRANNAEKVRASRARWIEANKDRFYAITVEWRKNNPERVRILAQNRRDRSKVNGGVLTIGLRGKLYKLQRGKCACCGKPLGENYHMDHIMPLSLGGMNIDSNIQLLRKVCNLQKHAKHPIKFMQERGFLL